MTCPTNHLYIKYEALDITEVDTWEHCFYDFTSTIQWSTQAKEWCKGHAQGKWTYTQVLGLYRVFIFELKEDAMMFKVAYGSET